MCFLFQALQHAALASNHKLKLTYINSADLEEDTKETVLHIYTLSRFIVLIIMMQDVCV